MLQRENPPNQSPAFPYSGDREEASKLFRDVIIVGQQQGVLKIHLCCSLGYTGILGWHRNTSLSACKKIKTSARSHCFQEAGMGNSGDGVISSAVLQQLPAHPSAWAQKMPMTLFFHFFYYRQHQSDIPPNHMILLDYCFIHRTVVFTHPSQ